MSDSLIPAVPLLGCLADDITGATDLALNLAQGGMRVEQWLTQPTVDELQASTVDAVVIAEKIRSIPPAEASQIAKSAVENLRAAGIKRFYFKYCSTFDSTPRGNIGPIAETLHELLAAEQTVFCPAFPRNGRTVYEGHLFVNGKLLNESGMERHPLNPMTDACLPRVLAAQTNHPVGLLNYDDVSSGPEQINVCLAKLRSAGKPFVICDTCDETHLRQLAEAVYDLPLVTGGSGLAQFLPDAYRRHGLLSEVVDRPALSQVTGPSLILSGSCSATTNRQVERINQRIPSFRVDVPTLMEQPEHVRAELRHFQDQQADKTAALIYSTAAPERVAEWQNLYGREAVAESVEKVLAEVAVRAISELGTRRLILAGGETSGAVTQRLGIRRLRIGPEICPGVPWTETMEDQPLLLACKSGNFGDDNFFSHALEMLP